MASFVGYGHLILRGLLYKRSESMNSLAHNVNRARSAPLQGGRPAREQARRRGTRDVGPVSEHEEEKRKKTRGRGAPQMRPFPDAEVPSGRPILAIQP